MPIAFLLAMQAAGMIVDYMGKQHQLEQSRLGTAVDEAGIETNIATSRLQTEEASLQAMKQLRQNLGSQAVMFAARGGSGMNGLFANASIGNFNADERMRKINQLGNEASLKAGKTLADLHQATYENQVNKDFYARSFNTLSTNPAVYGKIAGSFGLTGLGK